MLTGAYGRPPWIALTLAFSFGFYGLATTVPLMLFGAAAVRIPLTTIGLMQYLAPIIQFAIGVGIRHEDMPASRWAGFTLVWIAVMVFTWDSLRARRLMPVTVRA